MSTQSQPLSPDENNSNRWQDVLDVTKLGIDKAYGIEKLPELLDIELNEMLFAGDALFPGGNDYPVKQAGVNSIQVSNTAETKRVIETLLASLGQPDSGVFNEACSS